MHSERIMDHTERTIREFGESILLGSVSHRVGLDASERIHIGLSISTVLCINLLLAERLDGSAGITLSRLGVERTTVDLALEVTVVLDLADLFLGEGSGFPEVGVRLNH